MLPSLQLSSLSITKKTSRVQGRKILPNRFIERVTDRQTDRAGEVFLEKQQWRRHTLLCSEISPFKNPQWKARAGKNDSIGDCWRMANSTFPVFLMDNIKVGSPEDRTLVSRLHKETGCPRIGYLHVPPVSSFHFVELSVTVRSHGSRYLRHWPIIIGTARQGLLLLCVCIISSTSLDLMN